MGKTVLCGRLVDLQVGYEVGYHHIILLTGLINNQIIWSKVWSCHTSTLTINFSAQVSGIFCPVRTPASKSQTSAQHPHGRGRLYWCVMKPVWDLKMVPDSRMRNVLCWEMIPHGLSAQRQQLERDHNFTVCAVNYNSQHVPQRHTHKQTQRPLRDYSFLLLRATLSSSLFLELLAFGKTINMLIFAGLKKWKILCLNDWSFSTDTDPSAAPLQKWLLWCGLA